MVKLLLFMAASYVGILLINRRLRYEGRWEQFESLQNIKLSKQTVSQ